MSHMFVDQNSNVIAKSVTGVRVDYGIFRAANMYSYTSTGIFGNINSRMDDASDVLSIFVLYFIHAPTRAFTSTRSSLCLRMYLKARKRNSQSHTDLRISRLF